MLLLWSRLGPPGRNSQKSHPSTHIKQTTHQAAGSLKLPLPQKPFPVVSGKSKAKTGAVVQPVSIFLSKKASYYINILTGCWSLEDETERRKTKTSHKDQEESLLKRTCMVLRDKSPIQQQRKGRESTRVKVFPAGNTVMSASRVSFLQSLCNIPKFLSLVDLVTALVTLFTNTGYLNLAKGFTHT